jgi:hypothetical protein
MAKRKPKTKSQDSDEPEVTASNGDTATAVAEPEEKPVSRRKARQKMIPGTEPEQIPEIEEACGQYVSARDKRMILTEREVETKKFLAVLMKKHKLKTYAYDGQMIEYEHIDEHQIKVKKVRAAKESENVKEE